MNKISIIGRLTKDVETKDFNGRTCAEFGVASQNKHKDRQSGEYGTNFYAVTAWGQAAEIAAKYLRKGNRVGIVGDLIIRPYTGNDGTKRYAIEVNNAEVDLIETRAESEGNGERTQTSSYAAPASEPAPASQGFTAVETDDLPF